ncbi:DUF6894 family protein [Sphingobium sufflavum]|uniref:DUF6894 family protein n=1 Tax=Sphingobium sufflavum TaxID=1129547 RepID=UPI003899B727
MRLLHTGWLFPDRRMARYYFHQRTPGLCVEEPEGSDLPDSDAARQEVTQAALRLSLTQYCAEGIHWDRVRYSHRTGRRSIIDPVSRCCPAMPSLGHCPFFGDRQSSN